MKDITTTDKAREILERSVFNTKNILSGQLGISRPTLDSRLKEGNWKTLEEKWINFIYKQLNIN